MQLPPRPVESLWTLITAPAVWAVHFLLCYIAAALVCAKANAFPASFEALRFGIGLATAVALAAIVVAGLLAWRQWGFGVHDPPHDAANDEDRRRFQGLATLLLSGLSFVAVIYAALPVLFLVDCRP
jgi:Kef-type K+ transport system membrane component KefB